MKISEMLTPVLLAALVAVVMVSAALQQQSDRETRELLARLTEQLADRPPAAVREPDPSPPETDRPTDTPADIATGRPTKPSPIGPAPAEPDPPAGDPEGPKPPEASDPPNNPDPPAREPAEDDPSAAASPDLGELDWPTYGPTVEWTIETLMAGEYAEVRERFNDDLKTALPVTALASVMDPIRDKHGEFESIVDRASPSVRLPAGLHAFRVTVATANETVDPLIFTITVNDQQQIAGLYVQ